MSLLLATIRDSNSQVLSYPDGGIPRDFSDALFAFMVKINNSNKTKQQPQKQAAAAAADTAVLEEYNPETDFWAIHDGAGNFAAIALHKEQSAESNTRAIGERLVADLLKIAQVSVLARGTTMRSRVSKLLDDRCRAATQTGGGGAAAASEANDNVTIMKRALDGIEQKKKSSSSNNNNAVAAAPAAAAAAASSSKRPSSPSDVSSQHGSESSEERKSPKQKQQQRSLQTPEELGARVSKLTAETEAEWKKFQQTQQYKICYAVAAVAAVICLVFFICNPDLSVCVGSSIKTMVKRTSL